MKNGLLWKHAAIKNSFSVYPKKLDAFLKLNNAIVFSIVSKDYYSFAFSNEQYFEIIKGIKQEEWYDYCIVCK